MLTIKNFSILYSFLIINEVLSLRRQKTELKLNNNTTKDPLLINL